MCVPSTWTAVEKETEMIQYLTTRLDGVLGDYPSAGVYVMGDFNKMKLSTLINRFNLKNKVRRQQEVLMC